MKTTFLIITSCLLFSCSSSVNTIESNKDESYQKRSSKLFMIVYTTAESESLMEKVAQSVSSSLDSIKIESTYYLQESSSLALSPELPRKEIVFFGPDALIILGIEGGKYYNGALTDLQLGIAIYDPESQKIVWKAQVDSKKGLGLGGIENKIAMERLGNSIVNKMIEDDLLKID